MMRAHVRSTMLLVVGACALAGCVEERTLRGPAVIGDMRAAGDPHAAPGAPRTNSDAPAPAIASRSYSLGEVPFDNLTLPLLSADGRLIATHVGRTPRDSAILARHGALPPDDTAIQVFQLSTSARKPQSLGMVPAAAILGRSVDEEGFLIESVQLDSSRWIGKALWRARDVEWLVTDDRVNAFGVLGPGGAIAWCRRGINERVFHVALAIDDREWTTPVPDLSILPADRRPAATWLYPVFDGSPHDLAALRLHGRELDLVRLRAEPEGDRLVETAVLRLSDDADDLLASYVFSSIASAPVGVDSTWDMPGVLFFHPTLRTICLWKRGESDPTPIGAGTIAATPGAFEQVVATTGQELIAADLNAIAEARTLLRGSQVPRRTLRAGREIISAIVAGRGRLQMSMLQQAASTAGPVAPQTD